ncbi:bifunctional aminoglycoside phosphotransferase/ATP-binding protein [Boseongicola aestuarii]|uniref:Aminoglycoside phosphotransferase n=1 Tax=Boseongicola aestuarii TaxID=1470561 RepID=A0A238J6I9_9RHOB|nr:bifunctional aminoglycoside phosphotransferase/ATP-binding protein [Boseongicola aestuarii]SMX25852.1 hypothetical protein BOA8489_03997 [Boseongicola aestuarii]
MTTQSEVIAFLASPHAFNSCEDVSVIETHGALVFLCGPVALKLKRAVKYDYMDLSTVELRHAMLVREIELNAPFAPMIYRDVLPVTRQDEGLALAGDGPVVDWVLRMWRFPAEDELQEIAKRGELDEELALSMGEAVAAYHKATPIVRCPGSQLIGDILDELQRVFAEFTGSMGMMRIPVWAHEARDAWMSNRSLLDARGLSGHVRRVHGDMHLRNFVLMDGQPTLFDALEFDEILGTCDVLYDVAFLIMDMCHSGLQKQACRVLDTWLCEAEGEEDDGLAALPLFLSVRAAIRAMVLLQTDAACETPEASACEIDEYMQLADVCLRRPPPMLVAVGGYSASGKSILARQIAPDIGALPGAVILASDMERKAGLQKKQALNKEAYTSEKRTAVYQRIFTRAESILKAGHAVVLDATFLGPDLRKKAASVAAVSGVPFVGFWLDAPQRVLEDRIEARRKAASDANIDVLRRQLAAPIGDLSWYRLDASGTFESVYSAALKTLVRAQSCEPLS